MASGLRVRRVPGQRRSHDFFLGGPPGRCHPEIQWGGGGSSRIFFFVIFISGPRSFAGGGRWQKFFPVAPGTD